MTFRSIFVFWIVPFLIVICLTVVAAFAGTFVVLFFMVSTAPASLAGAPLILGIGLLFGSAFAAPCTVLLIPLFYALGGSRLYFGIFGLVYGVLGFATMEGWVFFRDVPRGVTHFSYFFFPPLLGGFAGLVAGLIYHPIMKAIEARFLRTMIDKRAGAPA
jgi:hypothetical protein